MKVIKIEKKYLFHNSSCETHLELLFLHHQSIICSRRGVQEVNIHFVMMILDLNLIGRWACVCDE